MINPAATQTSDNHECDVAIIGTGPAGLNAAITLSNYDLSVVVLDQQAIPGGQIYRNVEQQSDAHARLLGPDYQSGAGLVAEFRKYLKQEKGREQNLIYLPNTRVWSINGNKEIGYSCGQSSAMLTAKRIIIASGAMERPVPFPGWTLPGVMNAGAAQILFKAQQLLPEKDVVLAGSGPLLYLLAWQYLQAGLKIQALLDLSASEHHRNALQHFPYSLTAWRYLKKGLTYQWALKKAGIPVINKVTNLIARGDTRLSSISYRSNGQLSKLSTSRLLLHFGIIPQTNLSQLAGCQHHWHESQQSWLVSCDQWGETSVPGICVAGDAAIIHGAKSAQHLGRLTALGCLGSLGLLSSEQRNDLALEAQTLLAKDQKIRPFLEAWFRIPEELFHKTDDQTICCRCEEVSAGDIRQAVANGHTDINQVKFLTRCGMGPCQGRQCGQAVSQIVAAETDKTMAEVGQYRARPPLNQLTLGELASMYPAEHE